MFRVKTSEPDIKLFDSHCHLDFPIFDRERDTVIEQARKLGIEGILIPGVKKENWRFIRQLSALKKGIYASIGLHPMFMGEHKKQHLHDLELAAAVQPLWALGEIGLDYYDKNHDRKLQISLFKAQVEIAKSCKLPLILHVRKAHEDILLYLKALKFPYGGIVHAFNGSKEQAARYRELGFKLGFGGTITYPSAVKLRELAKVLPLEDIVLETDAPDMKPRTCDKDHNSPLNLFDNFHALCDLREETPEIIARTTTQNTKNILGIE